jgi:hypothetical protein
MSTGTWLRIIFGIWAIAFPVVACAPLLMSERDVTVAISTLFGLVVFWIAFVPWVIGLVALGFLIVLHDRGRRR